MQTGQYSGFNRAIFTRNFFLLKSDPVREFDHNRRNTLQEGEVGQYRMRYCLFGAPYHHPLNIFFADFLLCIVSPSADAHDNEKEEQRGKVAKVFQEAAG